MAEHQPVASSVVHTRCAASLDFAQDERGFAAGAGRLAGLAGALLGWRPGEFWDATPAELAAVIGALRGDAAEAAGASDVARLKEIFPDG